MRALPAAAVVLCVAALAGCAAYFTRQLDERYGRPDPARYDHPLPDSAALDYRRDVKPVLDNRCVVCHGCYDAPCQLDLTSYAGVTRGASRARVYDAGRLTAAEPSRLNVDARTNVEWRARGYHAVLNERADTPEANREGSILYRMLRLKRENPLPPGAILPAATFDFSLDRTEQCSPLDTMDSFERLYPQWGMPYGLPGIPPQEHAILTRWLEAGAPYGPPPPLSAAHEQQVAAWERFLNGDSPKARLMARYLYEHWFIGQLHFDELPGDEWFELVRSRTPPGKPIDVVATRRPYDDPGVARVYYRLRRIDATALAKTRMPLALNPARMARLDAWFITAPYTVTALPGYDVATASNPFIAFRELPVTARYRVMLEEARFTLTGFIKGPVCRGQLAVEVITDYFWVVFADPDAPHAAEEAAFLAREHANLRLPAEQGSTARLLSWLEYSRPEAAFVRAKSEYLTQRFGVRRPTLNTLWNGDGVNPNAALTVFRHFDSASVVQGLIGVRPQTAWVIGYPLLERIHYLLVAGYDVYGNAGHQLATRLYMDFLRMEGEMNFLALLPRGARQGVRDYWYRGARAEHIAFLGATAQYYAGDTGIAYRTGDPLAELQGMLKARYAALAPRRYTLASSGLEGAPLANLAQLSTLGGRAVSNLAEVSFLTVRDATGRDYPFTLIKNTAHSNVAELLGDTRRELPDEDTLLVVNGFVGAYPNAFFLVDAAALPAFVAGVRGLTGEADYRALAGRYGVRRTDPRFWSMSDALNQAYRRWAPRDAGLFDYNRFENR